MNKETLLNIDSFLMRESRQLYDYYLAYKKYLNKNSNDENKLDCIYCACMATACSYIRDSIGEIIREERISWLSKDYIESQKIEIDRDELLQIMEQMKLEK